jgi:hypothetical protein
MLIANAVLYRLAEICSQGVLTSKLECMEPANGVKNSILDEVCRIGRCTRPTRKPRVRPSMKLRKIATDELTQGTRVTQPGAREETR